MFYLYWQYTSGGWANYSGFEELTDLAEAEHRMDELERRNLGIKMTLVVGTKVERGRRPETLPCDEPS